MRTARRRPPSAGEAPSRISPAGSMLTTSRWRSAGRGVDAARQLVEQRPVHLAERVARAAPPPPACPRWRPELARARGGRRGRRAPTAGPMSRAPPTPTSGRPDRKTRASSVSSRRRAHDDRVGRRLERLGQPARRRERRVRREPRADRGVLEDARRPLVHQRLLPAVRRERAATARPAPDAEAPRPLGPVGPGIGDADARPCQRPR